MRTSRDLDPHFHSANADLKYPEWRTALFGLLFVHCLIQERNLLPTLGIPGHCSTLASDTGVALPLHAFPRPCTFDKSLSGSVWAGGPPGMCGAFEACSMSHHVAGRALAVVQCACGA